MSTHVPVAIAATPTPIPRSEAHSSWDNVLICDCADAGHVEGHPGSALRALASLSASAPASTPKVSVAIPTPSTTHPLGGGDATAGGGGAAPVAAGRGGAPPIAAGGGGAAPVLAASLGIRRTSTSTVTLVGASPVRRGASACTTSGGSAARTG